MQVRIPLLVLALFVLVTCAASSQTDESITFVHDVVARHPALKKVQEQIKEAQFVARASGLQPNPELTLSATTGDASEEANALVQRLEIGGQPTLRRSIAELRLQALELEANAVKRHVAAIAYRNWIELWKTQALCEVAELRAELMEEMTRVAARRYEVGEIAKNEWLRVELAASQAHSALIRARGALLSAQRQAVELSGRTVVTDIFTPPNSLLEEIEFEDALTAVDTHPMVLAGHLQTDAIRQGASLIRKERAPELSLAAYRSRIERHHGVEQGVQLSLSWPLFDWGSVGLRADAKRAEAEAEAAAVEEMVLELKLATAKAWTDRAVTQEKRDVLLLQAGRYEGLARDARTAYDVGLISLTDVLQTESSYRLARVELLEAEAKILSLEVDLLEHTGHQWPSEFCLETL